MLKILVHYVGALFNRFALFESILFKKYCEFKDVIGLVKLIKLGSLQFVIFLPFDMRRLVDDLIIAPVREKDYVESFIKFCLVFEDKIDFVFDIGSHIGYFVLLENAVFKDKHIVAVEPVDVNFKYLCLNLELNEIKNKITKLKKLSEKERERL